MIKSGSAWAGSFVTLDSTGALAASTDAAGVLYIDGVANAATVTITGTNPYKWSVTLPALTAGQRVDMYITGTIAAIATAGFVASEQADTALLSEAKSVIDNIHDTDLPAVKTETAAIKAKTDALDVSSVTVVTSVNGSTITILRGDTFSGALTDIGALTDYVSLDFTVKESYSKTDDEATIRIRKNASGVSDGLIRLNGAAATSSALGSIAIDDLVTGDITIALDETAADDLSTGNYVYDIQMISATGVKTLTYGKLIVSADVTRLVA